MDPSVFEKAMVDVLEIAVGEKLENFEIQLQDGNKKGEGFTSDMIFVSLKNKKTGETFNLVTKNVPFSKGGSTSEFICTTFLNEIQYYTKILPTLRNFQKSYPKIKTFDHYGKCYATCLQKGRQKIVMDNLKFKNFEVPPKNEALSKKSYEKIFSMYAEFHALSFAFKEHQRKEFEEITKILENNWLKVLEIPTFKDYLINFLEKVKRYLEEDREIKILEKFEKYVVNCVDLFKKSITYHGSFGTILHGDCWSNNLMVKYNSSKEIEDIKMIDFQLGIVASPALDLIYSLYSGAGKESLDNLEYLLTHYYNILSETLMKYGCDSEKLYPYEMLLKEWKEHCSFGLFTGILLWPTKLATDLTDMPTLDEFLNETHQIGKNEDFGINFDQIEFRKHALDLVRHMYDNDFL